MVNIEFVFALLLGVQGGALIWLCFERDKLVRRVNVLERLWMDIK